MTFLYPKMSQTKPAGANRAVEVSVSVEPSNRAALTLRRMALKMNGTGPTYSQEGEGQ